MNKTWLIILIIVILLIIFGLTRDGKESVSGEPIKIGILATMTGVGSYQGEQALKGLSLAVEEINQTGGIDGRPVELVIEDTKTKPADAVSAANKLIHNDGVKFIIGDSWTSTTAAVVPVTNENEIIVLAPLTTLDALTADDFFFRIIPKTQAMMVPLADYVFNEVEGRRVAILRQATPFGVEHADDFRREFELLGGEVVAEESFEVTSADVRSHIISVKEKNPDVIFNLHATGPMEGLLISQAKELGVDVKWIASWGTENADLLDQYESVIDGLIYPFPHDSSLSSGEARKFADLYEEKYGELPDLTASNFYDSLKILAFAIEKSEDTKEVKDILLNLKNYKGGSGVISFDSNGDVERPIFIKQIKNGEFVVLK